MAKKDKMIKKRKTESIIAKCQKAWGKISLSSEKEKNYKSDIKNEIDFDQASNNKYSLQI